MNAVLKNPRHPYAIFGKIHAICPTDSEHLSEHLSEHSSEHYRTNLATSARTYLRLNWLNPPKPSPSSTRYHL